MAFTTVTVTGTVLAEGGAPASGATVKFLLSEPITDESSYVLPIIQTATCDGNGNFSIGLVANDDPTTTPVGSNYQVVISYGQQFQSFRVAIPHASASVNLFSLPQI